MINQNAFYGCANLTCIHFYGKFEPLIADDSFYNVNTTVIVHNSSYFKKYFGPLKVVNKTLEECYEPSDNLFAEIIEEIHYEKGYLYGIPLAVLIAVIIIEFIAFVLIRNKKLDT